MKKEDIIKTAISKKPWKTPQMKKVDVAKNTQGKPNVYTVELGMYAPS
jgi:hypothetical protein